MLHSNTDASSFKLQPAPRPKKRPQNPPSIQRRPSGQPRPLVATDADSLRFGFDDDQELCLTPKASYSNLPLLASPKAGGRAKHDENRARSSTISNRSASSTSSVSRLLAAISLPLSPPPSTPQSSSVRETLTGMLSNKSPSPSSPLFPRNTLMSSLSSTCISPTSPSGGRALRKRMGWRAALSAPKQHETAIPMSPESPLTPRRADTLHTPTQASISSILYANHLQVDQENQSEPLSATLKALGAKRQTHPFPPNTNVLPVNQAEEAEEAEEAKEAFESPRTVKSPPYFESDLESSRESFQLLTAQRKIFHLPTWIRFEANHHARTQIVQNNRTAAQEFSNLIETMPKTSHLGDVAPDSPNGELFAGFDINPAPDTKQEQHVVKVVKTPTMATLRNSANRGPSAIRREGRVMGAISSVLPPFCEKFRIQDSLPKQSPTTRASNTISRQQAVKERRDGWGGVLTRTSWFPSYRKGPLVSPLSFANKSRLKSFSLQPHPSDLPQEEQEQEQEGEWQDIQPNPSHRECEMESSFLELNHAPSFLNPPPSQTRGRGRGRGRGWSCFRSSPHPSPSPSPCSKNGLAGMMVLNTWQMRRLPPAHEETMASKLITKGTKSIENRPIRKTKTISMKIKIALSTITATLIAAIIINVIVLSHSTSASKPRKANVDPMANTGLAYIPTTTTNRSMSARESSITKAAQLSKP
ncbi:hypothetical protein NDA14_002926 [Ustilago hordei]|nr:hypothetical protein NDA10_007166 [Ustilago hordei]KAJ1597747.1 hypothetical protein NDA14_002926 [Ustilago hordei]UTT89375.1 hypothetical protein NDA17_002934 [Ustilago hordei]